LGGVLLLIYGFYTKFALSALFLPVDTPSLTRIPFNYALFSGVSLALFLCLQLGFWRKRLGWPILVIAWALLAVVLCVGWMAVSNAGLAAMSYAGLAVLGLCALVSLAAMAVVNEEDRRRNRLARAAEEARDKFAGMVNSIDGVVYEWDPLGHCYRFVSGRVETILGYLPAAFTGDTGFWKEKVHPDDWRAVMSARYDAAGTGETSRVEYRMMTADGRWLWLKDIAAPCCLAKGQASIIRGVIIDVTPQHEAAEELERLHARVVESSRRAGMAEMATGVLHNVGNVLNSVNVSAHLLGDRLRDSRLPNLTKLAGLLRTEEHRLAEFLTTDERGRIIPRYLDQLAGHLTAEHAALNAEVQNLMRSIEHVREIVNVQQSTASVQSRREKMNPVDVIRDALRLVEEDFTRRNVRIAEAFTAVPDIIADRHRLLQILTNLLRNASRALADLPPGVERLVTIDLKKSGRHRTCIRVTDNGTGIPPENLNRIFSHGFTTRRDGHGFGLHSSALAAKEMGGTLDAASPGPGMGATFTLDIPGGPPLRDQTRNTSLSPIISPEYALP
jgi:PAS domain S-box-containing protein